MTPNDSSPTSPGSRLAVHARERDGCRFLIGVPPERPGAWAHVVSLSEDAAEVEGFGRVPLDAVTAFLAVYPNGQLLDSATCGLPLPEGIGGLVPRPVTDPHHITLADLQEGNRHLRVTFGRNPAGRRGYYATTLTNVSDKPIRVVRFGGYQRDGGEYVLANLAGRFYTPDEFHAWYGLKSPPWIPPSGSVTDPDNYGGPPTLWVYHCETEDGHEFMAGAVLKWCP